MAWNTVAEGKRWKILQDSETDAIKLEVDEELLSLVKVTVACETTIVDGLATITLPLPPE
jgi:hypothetical protein